MEGEVCARCPRSNIDRVLQKLGQHLPARHTHCFDQLDRLILSYLDTTSERFVLLLKVLLLTGDFNVFFT